MDEIDDRLQQAEAAAAAAGTLHSTMKRNTMERKERIRMDEIDDRQQQAEAAADDDDDFIGVHGEGDASPTTEYASTVVSNMSTTTTTTTIASSTPAKILPTRSSSTVVPVSVDSDVNDVEEEKSVPVTTTDPTVLLEKQLQQAGVVLAEDIPYQLAKRVEVISVLEKHDEFHLRTRNKIDELVDAFLTRTKNDDSTDMLHISRYDRHQRAEAEAADPQQWQVECRRQRVELIVVLEKHDEFPLRTRNKINEMVDAFPTRTKNDIHDMFCNVHAYDDTGIDDGEIDLDSDRDTEAEVETALRVFPEVLSRRGGRSNMYPIQYIASRYSTMSFILLLARLALEFGLFEEEERGGLLIEGNYGDNILQYLVHEGGDEDADADEIIQNVLIRLRQMGYFKKEDIQEYGLVVLSCKYREISEIKFRFLVEWDPTSLIKTDGQTGRLPLHLAATHTIQNFRMVFEYGIRYYPKKKGISLLFQRSGFGPTPFLLACQISFRTYEEVFDPEDVMKVVEDILIRYSDTPINITEALITAAIDEDIHLNCVYFLLRREPDIVMKLLSVSPHRY
ncbi:hypothetical protein FRACYDRAFT_249400 [Fragilariopsis cylindrus CCMP1102]|uniref:Uncharacterized protein n=1 Tax=Fragilariopsis cylindrus CCMP1102 TaxID=635003 RepID=A0A1E7ER65_9STRA|nr:hypothetical protein FRACYDRAFT_249400 [Fragilariopsis cylindrus CCMP1102]|eukprot:OEU08510.1 hypothetical protein FRACYDRAFT_249400 [Fragilariopsis cylindrus CCMP1102]